MKPHGNVGQVAEHVHPKRLRWEGATVLVVDDDTFIRKFVNRILGQAGFKVLLAADGMAGVALYRQHLYTIQAALIDVMMPRLDGYGTVNALRESRPGLPIIMISGSAEKRGWPTMSPTTSGSGLYPNRLGSPSSWHP